jgi:hypothetical protein
MDKLGHTFRDQHEPDLSGDQDTATEHIVTLFQHGARIICILYHMPRPPKDDVTEPASAEPNDSATIWAICPILREAHEHHFVVAILKHSCLKTVSPSVYSAPS